MILIIFFFVLFRTYASKIITIQFSTDNNIASTDALRIIKYSDYPTFKDLLFISHIVAPKEIIMPNLRGVNSDDVEMKINRLYTCCNAYKKSSETLR